VDFAVSVQTAAGFVIGLETGKSMAMPNEQAALLGT